MTALQQNTRIGQYCIERLLQRGGFASVAVGWRVVGQEMGERVAIKIAHTRAQSSHAGNAAELVEAYADTLQGEATTLQQLRHPGIVRIHPIQIGGRTSYVARALEVDGQPWCFVMEYLAGGSLEALVKACGRLDPSLAVEIAHQVCLALGYLHTAGFAHLDIKPGNILFRQPLGDGSAPEAVLIDFGAAQKFFRQADVEQMALVYAPPERVRIRKGLAPPESFTDKPAADVYSLGITLYRMVTARLPFTGSRAHVMTDIMKTTPTQPRIYAPALSHLPALNDLIMAMLEKQPANRPNVQEVMERLERVLPSPRVWRKLPPLPEPDKPRANSWKRVFIGFSLLITVAAPAGYWLIRDRGLPLIPLPAPVAMVKTSSTTPTNTASPRVTSATRTVTRPPATTVAAKGITPIATTLARGTATPLPEPTLTPIPTYTAAPTPPLQPTPAATPVVNPAPVVANPAALSPTLQGPANNENRRGGVEFRWQPVGPLPAGAGYEVVWWPEGADPNSARGFANPTTGTSLNVNLDGFFDNSRTILWTVLVVDARPNSYKRLTQPSLSNARKLTYQPAEQQPDRGGTGKP